MSTATDPASSHRTRLGFVLLIALLILAASGKSILYDTLDPDCWWHLRVADQLRRDGIGPIVDELSFASIKTPWTPYSWLAELGMKTVWDAGGYRAAIATQAILVALIFAFIALTCIEMTRRPRPYMGIALALLFAEYLALPYLSFRPATLALAMLACCIWLIARDRRLGQRSIAIWSIVPITMILINVHFFAIFVPLFILMFLTDSCWERYRGREVAGQVRRYAILTVLCTLACAATPMLPGLLRSIANYGTTDPMVQAGVIAELLPFYASSIWPITLAILLASIACMIHRRDRFDAAGWLCLAVGFVAMLRMGRLSPVFVMIAAPMLAAALPEMRGAVLGRRIVIGVIATVLVCGGFHISWQFPSSRMHLSTWLNRLGPAAIGYPCEAADFVAQRVPRVTGRLINEFNWGGYLAWQLGPRFQVYMDARTQLYTPDFWTRTCLTNDNSTKTALRTITADAAIVPAGSHRLGIALRSLGWKPVYRDARAEVLVLPDSAIVSIVNDE